MLYASQIRAKDELTQCLATSPACVLQGLSGSGKSLVAGQVIAEGFKGGRAVDEMRAGYEIERLKEMVAQNLRIVILSGTSNSSNVTKQFDSAVPIVTMGCMTAEEVEGWMNSLTPPLEEGERSLMRTYGLAVPLLLEYLSHRRPVTEITVIPLCNAYLQGVVEQNGLGGKELPENLRQILAGFGASVPPDSIVQSLQNCAMARFGETPMSLLGTKLSHGEELPTPETLDIFTRYEEWLRLVKEEPNFNLFIRDLPGAEKALAEIGYVDSLTGEDTMLRRFSMADHRKGATFYDNGKFGGFREQMSTLHEAFDNIIFQGLLGMARASGVQASVILEESRFGDRERPKAELIDAPNALYVHKHDHTHSVVMPVAYTFECYLQRAGIPYVISYNKETFRYDPATKTYEPIDTPKVDYYKEAYGARWAAEDAAGQAFEDDEQTED